MSHDCCSPKHNKKLAAKKGIDPFLAGIGVVTVLLLVGAIFFGSKMGATAQDVEPDAEVAMSVAENTYDWGTVDYDGGIVSKTFAIENSGATPLKLFDVKTSCMCTTAQLKSASQTSKKFGMHEKSSSVFEVKPGEKAELVVEFDPAFHGPSGVGPINRTVTMTTNSTDNPTLAFQLTANVFKK
ncbi:DUF1573 domain-containing protein [Candidatus Saccharibacteria bacterium]|nr:DUF1573 domain-containing protein [Candidatus Saccharibacteria bacterium]